MQIKKLKYIAAVFMIAGIALTGCLKDGNAPGAENYSHSPALVSFQYTGFAFSPATAAILGTPNDSLAIEVTLSVASLTLGTPVTATIAPDQATLDAFNSDNGTAYAQLPAAQYTISGGGTVTINPGQQMVSFTVHFAGDKINFDTSNALALKITSATGATIATNLNTYVIQIKLRSIYEGSYAGSGARIRFNGGTEASGERDSFVVSGDIPFATVGVKEIEGQLGDAGSGYNMALVIHDDQPAPYPVDVIPDPTVDPSLTPSAIVPGTSRGQSTYDPVTKTFDLHFGYTNSAGALREVNEQLVLNP